MKKNCNFATVSIGLKQRLSEVCCINMPESSSTVCTAGILRLLDRGNMLGVSVNMNLKRAGEQNGVMLLLKIGRGAGQLQALEWFICKKALSMKLRCLNQSQDLTERTGREMLCKMEQESLMDIEGNIKKLKRFVGMRLGLVLCMH